MVKEMLFVRFFALCGGECQTLYEPVSGKEEKNTYYGAGYCHAADTLSVHFWFFVSGCRTVRLYQQDDHREVRGIFQFADRRTLESGFYGKSYGIF